jgi:hypothetical protein
MHYFLCYQHPPHRVVGLTCRNWCCFHVVVTLFEEFCHTLNRREIGARAAFVMSFMEQAVSCTGLFSSPLLTCLQPHLVSPVLFMYQCRRVSLWSDSAVPSSVSTFWDDVSFPQSSCKRAVSFCPVLKNREGTLNLVLHYFCDHSRNFS